MRPLASKNMAAGQLNAGISAAATTIPLKAGEGANFPTTKCNICGSPGTSTRLNRTGIGTTYGVVAGDIIENVTDGSWAVVLAAYTDYVITTRLRGGSDNTWSIADVWAVNRFVVTVVKYDTDGETVLKREHVLIDSRTTDNLSVNAAGRGYDDSSAQSFDANDHVYLFQTSAMHEGLRQAVAQLTQLVDYCVSVTGQEIYAATATGTDAYSVTLTPAPTAYSTGQELNVKIDVANTGPATIDVNGLGAKSILRIDGSALEDNDLPANGIIHLIYNGTAFFVTTPAVNALSAAIAAEVTAFFGATNMSGAEAESLTDTSVLTGLHHHKRTFGAAACSVSGAGNQVIAHGLGATPKRVIITASMAINGTTDANSHGLFDGTNYAAAYTGMDAGAAAVNGTSTSRIVMIADGTASFPQATVAIDGNNITLTWAAGTAAVVFTWEAEV